MKGKFITFEGPEGGGKTTQIRLLEEYLRKKDIPHISTREPGGPPISEQIRKTLLNPDHHGMTARTELLLMLASRAQHTEQVLLPALDAGKIVLCDRYNDSTMAYQSFGRGFDFEITREMCVFASRNLMPDRTFLLDIGPVIGIERSSAVHKETSPKGLTDRLESEEIEFHRRVREGFLELARRYPERMVVLDGRRPVEELQQEIITEIEKLIEV